MWPGVRQGLGTYLRRGGGWMANGLDEDKIFIRSVATNGRPKSMRLVIFFSSLPPSRPPSYVPSPVSPRNFRPPRPHQRYYVVIASGPHLSHTTPRAPPPGPLTPSTRCFYIRKSQAIDYTKVSRPKTNTMYHMHTFGKKRSIHV